MTRPIYEPTPSRTDAYLGFGQDQLFRRPAPTPDTAGGANPWIVIFGGAASPTTGTWWPVPFENVAYDPALVTLGDIFDLTITDTGDPGNDRYEIITKVKGVYRAELVTQWDEVTTDGSNTYGYAVQNLFFGGLPNSLLFPPEAHRGSADWPKNNTVSDHEMLDNPYLITNATIFSASTDFHWTPRGKQTTGVTRGLGGVKLYIEAMQYSDASTWTYDSV